MKDDRPGIAGRPNFWQAMAAPPMFTSTLSREYPIEDVDYEDVTPLQIDSDHNPDSIKEV